MPVSYYLIYRSTDGSAFALAGKASGTASTFEDTLCCFGTYIYQLRAVDSLGNVSATSNTASVEVIPEREWPFASYWVHHQGFSDFPTPALPLEIKWRVSTNAGPFAVAGPVIKNGRVYESGVDKVNSRDLATGAVIATTGSIPGDELVGANTSPAVIGNRIIVGAESFTGVTFGAARVHAYDAETLNWLWTSDAVGIGGFSNIASANGLVFVGAYNQLTALSIVDGSLVWQRNIGSFVNHPVGGPVACDNLVYAAFGNGTFVAVDANTGVTKWSKVIGTDPVGNAYEPVLKGGRVLVGSGLSLLVLDAYSGLLVGQMTPVRPEPEAGVLFYAPVIDSSNRVFFFSGGEEQFLGIMPILHAYDASAVMSGGPAAFLWERTDLLRCPMSTVNGVLYAFQDAGASAYPAGMMLLDNATGNLLQRIEEVPYPREGLNTHPAWGPAFSGDFMVLRGSSAVTNLFGLAPGPGVSAPTGLSALGGVGTVDLYWEAAIPASFQVAEYRIFRSSFAGGFNWGEPVATVSSSYFTDSAATGLEPDMMLYYVVRARDTLGNISPPSNLAFASDPLEALVMSPTDGEVVTDTVDVVGTAAGATFRSFRVRTWPVNNPDQVVTLAESPRRARKQILTKWLIGHEQPGRHVIELTVEGNGGGRKSVRVVVEVSDRNNGFLVSAPSRPAVYVFRPGPVTVGYSMTESAAATEMIVNDAKGHAAEPGDSGQSGSSSNRISRLALAGRDLLGRVFTRWFRVARSLVGSGS
jgi:outer membrane protein assembly factor BamB